MEKTAKSVRFLNRLHNLWITFWHLKLCSVRTFMVDNRLPHLLKLSRFSIFCKYRIHINRIPGITCFKNAITDFIQCQHTALTVDYGNWLTVIGIFNINSWNVGSLTPSEAIDFRAPSLLSRSHLSSHFNYHFALGSPSWNMLHDSPLVSPHSHLQTRSTCSQFVRALQFMYVATLHAPKNTAEYKKTTTLWFCFTVFGVRWNRLVLRRI